MKEDIYFVSPSHSTEPFYINICGVSRCDGSYLISRPASNVLCMEYVYAGTGTVRYRGREYHPSAGDVYLLPCGEDHEYLSDAHEPWHKIWFNAAGPLTEELVRAYALDDVPHYPGIDLSTDFESILTLAQTGSNAHNINERCALMFHEMLQKLYLSLHPTKPHSDEANTVKAYLDAHLAENVSVEALSALIYKSRSQTIRIFKSEFGLTPYDYLLDSRIRAAKALLRGTNLLIKDIADRVGFSDEHYFSDLFKKKTGRTPSSYRSDR